jgi:hypothetical protein
MGGTPIPLLASSSTNESILIITYEFAFKRLLNTLNDFKLVFEYVKFVINILPHELLL